MAADRTAKFWFRNITSARGSHLPARRTAVQSPPRHSSAFHDCSKQERLRHGDAYGAPALRLSGLKVRKYGPLMERSGIVDSQLSRLLTFKRDRRKGTAS